MRKFFVALVFCIILTLSIPATAQAGRTLGGGWCECGSVGCICDEGEVPPTGNITYKPAEPDKPQAQDGTELLIFLFALLFLTRIRA